MRGDGPPTRSLPASLRAHVPRRVDAAASGRGKLLPAGGAPRCAGPGGGPPLAASPGRQRHHPRPGPNVTPGRTEVGAKLAERALAAPEVTGLPPRLAPNGPQPSKGPGAVSRRRLALPGSTGSILTAQPP